MKGALKIVFSLILLLIGNNSIYADSAYALSFNSSHKMEMLKNTDFDSFLSEQSHPFVFHASTNDRDQLFMEAEETISENVGFSLVKKLTETTSYNFLSTLYSNTVYQTAPSKICNAYLQEYFQICAAPIYLLVRVFRI
jgi:hypothetical protein